MECYTYLRNVTDLLSDGKTPYERRFWQPIKRPIIPFGSLVEYHPFTAKDQSRIHQFGKKVLPGLFLGYAFYAERNLEGWRTGRRPWGVENDGRIRNLLKKTQCERGDISERKRKIYFSKRRWTNQTPWKRSGTVNIHLGTASTKFKEKIKIDFLGESERSVSPPQDSLPDAGEAINDFWSMSRNFIYRHHVELRVKLNSPRQESFPIPLKYINVSITTCTNFGCQAREAHRWLLEYRWVSRLVRSLVRFHTIYSAGRKSSRRIYVVREEMNEETAYIEARSPMARALEING